MAFPGYRSETIINYSDGGAPGFSVQHWTKPVGADNQVELADIKARLRSLWGSITSTAGASTGGSLAKDTQVRIVERLLDLSTDPPTIVEEGSPTLLVVTGASSDLPPANQILVTLATSTLGRGNRGRIFIGPLAVTATNADGQLASGVRANMEPVLATLTGLPDGAQLAIAHRNLVGVVDSMSVATEVGVRSKISVLRSRRD